MKAFIFFILFIGILQASPFLAFIGFSKDNYPVVQDPATKKCFIVSKDQNLTPFNCGNIIKKQKKDN